MSLSIYSENNGILLTGDLNGVLKLKKEGNNIVVSLEATLENSSNKCVVNSKIKQLSNKEEIINIDERPSEENKYVISSDKFIRARERMSDFDELYSLTHPNET